MLLTEERERIEKGEPAALASIASAWAERHVRFLLASSIQVETLAQRLAQHLKVDIQNGKLLVYDTFLKNERPYEAGDDSDLEKGLLWMVPRTVDEWLETHELAPTLATPSITPAVHWSVQTPFGVLKADDTERSRLVRLADLVQWLMTSRQLSCGAAVELVCSVLSEHPSEARMVLYLLSESDFAKVLPSEHSFFYSPIWCLGDPYPTGDVTDKGVLGAVKYMREYWGQSLAPGAGSCVGQHVLEPLAIHMEVAHWLWGYGACSKQEKPGSGQSLQHSKPVAVPLVKRSRSDLLSNAIKNAQQVAKNPDDASEVFNILRGYAGSKGHPIIGVSEEGLKWLDANDAVRYLSLKNLRDRFTREKKKQRAGAR